MGLIENRPEDHQESLPQDRFTNDRALLMNNTYAYQYVHVLFLVPEKLIIYSRAVEPLFLDVIKRAERYSHRYLPAGVISVVADVESERLRRVRCASHVDSLTLELDNIPSEFFSSFFLSSPVSPFFVIVGPALFAARRSDCTGNRGR